MSLPKTNLCFRHFSVFVSVTVFAHKYPKLSLLSNWSQCFTSNTFFVTMDKRRKGFYQKINGSDFVESQRNSDNSYGMAIEIDYENEGSCRNCCLWCQERYFTKEKLKRRFPIFGRISNYSLADLKGDLVAGISVAFTIIPQGLGLAVLAGLPPQFGLYTSFIGCFIYALFGTCKDAAVGPTSILAILIAPYVATGGVPYAILLSFLTGCTTLVFGILNFGFVVDFISFPVISSFSTAAAISIAVSQLKTFCGIQYKGSRFWPTVKGFFSHVSEANHWDVTLGVVCLLFLILMQMNKDSRFFQNGRRSWWKTFLNNFYAGTVVGRNAIVLLITAFISWKLYDGNPFSITGYIQSGLPTFQVPSFSAQVNGTDVNFDQMFLDLAPGMVAVSLVGLMETVAVAKAFTSSIKLDATQEMIALGLCNIVGSFFGAFPAAGSFSRSAVNHNSGVRTTIGGCITGLLVIVALMTMSKVFELIPKAALAAIIIAAILPMIRFDDIWTIWKTKPVDIIPYAVTLTSSLVVGLEYGISIGVLISVGMLLYEIARPRVTIVIQKTPGGETFLCVKPDRNIYFPSVEYMKVKINKALPLDEDEHSKLPVVVDGEHVFKTDSTAVVGIKNMIRSFNNVGRPVIFYNLRRSVLRSITSSLSNRDDLAYCKTEQEVYAAVKFHKENGFITNSYEEENHNHNERYWLTQSTEESTRR